MRNISKKYKILKCLITFLQLPRKPCFVSAVLKKNYITFPRELVITVPFSHAVHLNFYGSHLPDE